MGAFSVATGVTLLYDEGLLPPNPERQAIAFASPADLAKLGSEGLAMTHTAANLAMEDQAADGTVELSSAAMQFLAQNLAASEPAAPKAPSSDTATQQSAYPYAGWSQQPEPALPPAKVSGTLPTDLPLQTKAAGSSAPATEAPVSPINVLA